MSCRKPSCQPSEVLYGSELTSQSVIWEMQVGWSRT